MTDELMKAVRDECATDGCYRAATEYFESGGVGSRYCSDCATNVRQLATQAQTKGDDLVERLLAGAMELHYKQGVNPDSTVFGRAATRIQSLTASNEAARKRAAFHAGAADDAENALQAAQAEIARMREALQEARDMAWGAELNDRTAAVLRIIDTALTPQEPT